MLRQSLFLAAASAFSQAIVAVLYVIVARNSGPAQLGSVVVIVAAANFVAGILHFGTNNLWVRELASQAITYRALYIKLELKLFYSLLACVAITTLALVLYPDNIYYFVGTLAFSIVFFQSFQVPLKAAAAGIRLAISIIIERIIAGLVFGLLLAAGIDAPVSLICALTVGALGAGLSSYLLSSRTNRQLHLVRKHVWPWKGSASYGSGGVILSAQSLDAVILQAIAGPVATGIYGAVNRWTQPMSVFAGAFSTAGLPIVAQKQSLRKSYSQLRRSWWLIAVAALICLLVALFSTPIVSLLLGPEFANSSAVLAVLALGTIPALLNQPLYVFMQAMHLERSVAICVSLSVAIQLSSCVLLGHLFGALGAALSMGMSQVLLLLGFTLILFLRHGKLSS